ncbi:MAG: cupredoxin domain-containing protein [Nitrososphaera sp.]
MKKKENRPYRMTRNKAIAYAALAAVVATIGYFSINATIPANGTAPVLSPPLNHFLKATHTSKGGYLYVTTSPGGAKGIRNTSGAIVNPTYTMSKGGLQTMHFINEDYDTHSAHNLNIDEFNVHTRDLGYFESQTVSFVTDKAGTFQYYCSIHPEMKGEIIIE